MARRRIALLFPGQGSQQVGMGRDTWEIPAVRRLWEAADQVLDLPLSQLCFQGPQEELTATEVAQPALLVTSLALLQVLEREAGGCVQADFCAGHSLGEYTALVAAGALDPSVALRLVRRRGELMRDAARQSPGSMAALLRLPGEVVKEICRDARSAGWVEPANWNAPGEVVISGATTGVQAAMEIAQRKGGRVILLRVSGAFHSQLMEPAARGMEQALDQTPFRLPRCPVVVNVTAQPVTQPGAFRELLVRQLISGVQWEASVRRLAEEGVTDFIEIGPGRVLTGLVRRIMGDETCRTWNVSQRTEAIPVGAWLRDAGSVRRGWFTGWGS